MRLLLLSTATIVSLCGTAAAAAATVATASSPNPQQPNSGLGDADAAALDSSAYLFANPPPGSAAAARLRIPTSRESAVLGRRILGLSPLGVIATVFPPAEDHHGDGDSPTDRYRRRLPPGIGGAPHGLMEYIASCEDNGGNQGGGEGEDSDVEGGRRRGEEEEDGRSGGNPTMLAITIATSFRNIAAGSNVSLAVRWTPRYPPAKGRGRGLRRRRAGDDGEGQTSSAFGAMLARLPLVGRFFSSSSGDEEVKGHGHHHPHHHHHRHHRHHHHEPALPYSAANLPRFSLLGYIEPIPGGDNLGPGEKGENDDDPTGPNHNETVGARLARCFVAAHPDARWWLPGSRVHESHFVRLVVTHVYWVGGFGDRAYIGWIPAAEWAGVTRAAWSRVRLPGEEPGWEEGWDYQEEERGELDLSSLVAEKEEGRLWADL